MALLQRMRHLIHSAVESLTAKVFQLAARIERDGLLVSLRFHALFENVFNAADVAVHGTGVHHLLHRQSVHAVREYRHQEVNFEQWRHGSQDRVNYFIRAVAEFYYQDTVWPFALFDVAYRMYRMLVGVLQYMRATWMLQKASMNAGYFMMLLDELEIFPNGDF